MPAESRNASSKRGHRAPWLRRLAIGVAAGGFVLVGVVGILWVGGSFWLGSLTDFEGNEDEIACDDFEFDRQAWNDESEDNTQRVTERERQASALSRCGTLIGLTRAEVEAMLGPTRRQGGPRVTYNVGWINDGFGPGDASSMTLHFDADDRVRRVVGGEDQI